MNRYLWPLIHYHKFLAKCIKKLKRNGVDVKLSVSPVSVFLREEVCAVSDHLAALSLLGSDEWMSCLCHFNGWCDAESEHYYRAAISSLKLRPVDEPGDVDSPLLRSQIDKHFLRTMAHARAQMRENAQPVANRTKGKPQNNGPPPVYPRGSGVPQHIPMPVPDDQRRHRGRNVPNQQYPPQHWWAQQQHWEQARLASLQAGYCDNSSAHSSISVDSYQTMAAPMYEAGPMGLHPSYHYPYPPSLDASHTSLSYSEHGVYDPNMHYPQGPWVDPSMMYHHMPMQPHVQYYPQHPPQTSPSKHEHVTEQQYPDAVTSTPVKSKADDSFGLNASMSQSPFWSHLDQAAMANLATPVKATPQMTPRRLEEEHGEDAIGVHSEDITGYTQNAQPLLLQHGLYYGSYHGPAVSR